MIDLTYHNFGRLTVIGRDYSYPSGSGKSIYWKCICECGKEISVNGRSLRKGDTKSCGCLRSENCKKIGSERLQDLTGQKFGYLTVINRGKDYITPKGHHEVQWNCECECGNQVLVRAHSLATGKTISCGCIKSKGERFIIDFLIKNNIPFETQKSFETCRFPNTDRLVKFDFYINNEILLEFDGIQHFKTTKGWSDEEHLSKTQQRDEYKNNWCLENNIPLVRIKYDEELTEEKLNNYINKKNLTK